MVGAGCGATAGWGAWVIPGCSQGDGGAKGAGAGAGAAAKGLGCAGAAGIGGLMAGGVNCGAAAGPAGPGTGALAAPSAERNDSCSAVICLCFLVDAFEDLLEALYDVVATREILA